MYTGKRASPRSRWTLWIKVVNKQSCQRTKLTSNNVEEQSWQRSMCWQKISCGNEVNLCQQPNSARNAPASRFSLLRHSMDSLNLSFNFIYNFMIMNKVGEETCVHKGSKVNLCQQPNSARNVQASSFFCNTTKRELSFIVGKLNPLGPCSLSSAQCS